MKINTLKLRNFKGFSGEFALGPVTLVTGQNFRHKTTIPLAIRLALSGKLPPPIGVQGVYGALAGNPTEPGQLAVELLLDEGRSVNWLWNRDAKGKISTEGGVSPDLAMPEMLMEPRLFFAKTAADRIKTIFAACEIDVDISEAIKNRLGEVQEPPVFHCEKFIDGIWAKMAALPDDPPQAFTSMLLDWLKTSAKTESDACKMAQGAFQAFRVGEPAEPSKDVSKPLAEAREKLVAMRAKVGSKDNFYDIEKLGAKLFLLGEPIDPKTAKTLELVVESPPMDEEEIDDVKPDLLRAHADLSKKLALATGQLNTILEQLDSLEGWTACPTCRTSKRGWKESVLTELNKQRESFVAGVISLEDQLKEVTDQLDAIKSFEQAKAKLETFQKQQALAKEIAKLKELPPKDMDYMGKVETQQMEVNRLEAEQARFMAGRADYDRKELLEKDILKHGCGAEVYKAVAKIVSEEQGKLIDGAFTQVLRVAKHFTDGMLNSPLEFVNGELGRRVSQSDRDQGNIAPVGAWISHEAFSGTEELLAYAGFSVALCADAPVKIVMLDELGRLDAQRKTDIANRMLQLTQKGVIDQAVLVDVSAKDYLGIIQTQKQNLKSIQL